MQYLDNMEALSLWMTGSTLIRQRLGIQGGWKVFCVGGTFGPPFSPIWPRSLINHLHGLSILRVSPPHRHVLLPMLKPTLDDIIQLPKSLTEFQIDFIDPVTDDWLSSLPPQLTRLSLPFNRCLSGPGLRHLHSGIGTLDLRSNTRIIDVSCLPRTLLHYICHDKAVRPCPNLGALLPPDLIELEIVSSKRSLPIWNLVDLACLASHPSLAVLTIQSIGNSIPNLPSLVLHRSLTSLSLSGNPNLKESVFPSLPPLLQRLVLLFKENVNLEWSDASIGALPRTLTHLEVMPMLSSISPNWKNHSFPCQSTLTPECLMFLPSSLRVLRLHHIIPSPTFVSPTFATFSHRLQSEIAKALRSHFDKHCHDLPVGLVDLTLPMKYGRYTISPSIDFLPRSITSLPFSSLDVNPTYTWKDAGQPQLYEKPEFSDAPAVAPQQPLPPGLSHQAIRSFIETVGGPMTYLNSGVSRFPGPFWFKFSPSFDNLRTLIWSYQNYTVEPKAVPINQYPSPTSTASNSVLRFRKTKFATAYEILQALPRKLATLHIFMPLIDDEDILALPDTLTELVIYASETFLTDECIPALPHGLTSLLLSTQHAIRGGIYPWPKKLLHLRLSDTHPRGLPKNIPKSQFFQPKFPIYLQSLELANNALSSSLLFQHGAPPFLTSLKITLRSPHITADLLPLLPETLVKFSYPFLQLFDEDVAYIPRSVRSFVSTKGGSRLTESSSTHWPPLLRKLCIRGDLFSNDTIKKLPRTLTTLRLPYAHLCDYSSIRSCFGQSLQQWTIAENSDQRIQ